MGKSLSKNANDKFGGTSGQKLNNCRVSRWDIFLLAPLHDGLGNVIIWRDHLNLGDLAVWVEEGYNSVLTMKKDGMGVKYQLGRQLNALLVEGWSGKVRNVA